LSEWRLSAPKPVAHCPVCQQASQANSVASGQGIAGSQAAAGVTAGGGNANAKRRVSDDNPGRPGYAELRPFRSGVNNFGHRTTPQPNIVQSITPVLISNTRVYNATLQQGFHRRQRFRQLQQPLLE
jgi:hypothetical protein